MGTMGTGAREEYFSRKRVARGGRSDEEHSLARSGSSAMPFAIAGARSTPGGKRDAVAAQARATRYEVDHHAFRCVGLAARFHENQRGRAGSASGTRTLARSFPVIASAEFSGKTSIAPVEMSVAPHELRGLNVRVLIELGEKLREG